MFQFVHHLHPSLSSPSAEKSKCEKFFRPNSCRQTNFYLFVHLWTTSPCSSGMPMSALSRAPTANTRSFLLAKLVHKPICVRKVWNSIWTPTRENKHSHLRGTKDRKQTFAHFDSLRSDNKMRTARMHSEWIKNAYENMDLLSIQFPIKNFRANKI